MITYFTNKDISRRSDMFKYDVGDKVIYKGDECKVIIQEYAKECTEDVVINEHKYYTVEDKYGNRYCCNEGELREMRRIDEIINSENVVDILVTMLEQSCGTHCIFSKNCEGKNCQEGIKAYLNKEIDESKEEPIEVKRREEEEELKTPDEYLEDAIKEIRKETNNDFMDIYKNIVNNIVDICVKKNKDYGSSVVDSYEKFGDISYLTRITDKYNRLVSLYQHQDKCEVVDEKYDDTITDLANYCLLWLANRELVKNK